ncbi:adenylate/guanylate cyclase domain-containing protein [Vibrio sp. Isolate30]|uniref:adenylate/guanylate cyclase domain-containing protein n=1 Tax=Vibrio sp. Isolate30 TaxID=2908536 RepID=UPI001EFD422F|nr:adenylate/guanylate cyclase domain-containing protein [Vibrio sp. Isolate30]MCG9632750.1 adenylate/guanylate cyclase domain-containing protein [Vibrio sp. Isolate30]
MVDIENVFGDFYQNVKDRRQNVVKANSISIESSDSSLVHESLQTLPSGPQEEYLLQTQIRPLFGKEGVNNFPIGTHPDFVALEGTSETQHHYMCTMFVDIKGSTRLSLLYDLDSVFIFKNAVIQTCIEVVRSFDGHVHRLMGDAVMAFFGGSTKGKEDAIADAINCSITLRAILEESIKPWMTKQGLESKDFGFRVGCDFGNDEEVLWGSFGYRSVGEVSATGLPVDMASKLQSLAGKNQTMLGQGLLDFVYWPAKYSNIKERKRGQEKESLPIVVPNMSDSGGNLLNYNMRLLDYYKCIDFSALPLVFREKVAGSTVKHNPSIEFRCFVTSGNQRQEYISASCYLEPGHDLLFEVKATTRSRLAFPLKVVFKKTNHGPKTPEDERDIEQDGVVRYLQARKTSTYNSSIAPYSITELNEGTSYRGLHTMKCEVFDNNQSLIFRDVIGVMIK